MSSQDCGDSSVWIQDCIAEITVAGQNCMVETALYSRDKSVQSQGCIAEIAVAGQNCMVETALYSRDKSVQSQGCIASQNCIAETPLSRGGAESVHDHDLQG